MIWLVYSTSIVHQSSAPKPFAGIKSARHSNPISEETFSEQLILSETRRHAAASYEGLYSRASSPFLMAWRKSCCADSFIYSMCPKFISFMKRSKNGMGPVHWTSNWSFDTILSSSWMRLSLVTCSRCPSGSWLIIRLKLGETGYSSLAAIKMAVSAKCKKMGCCALPIIAR